MANSLGKDLLGKLVRLKNHDRPARVVGGYGAYATTAGRALYVEFPNGVPGELSGYDVVSIVDEYRATLTVSFKSYTATFEVSAVSSGDFYAELSSQMVRIMEETRKME